MDNKDSKPPLHMQEIDDDVPILPNDSDIPPEEQPENATFVELGSIQTDPKTSKLFDNLHPILH